MKEQQVAIKTNIEKWLKSYHNNRDPKNLRTVQINSTKELLDRVEKITGKIEDPNKQDDKKSELGVITILSDRLKTIIKMLETASQGHQEQMLENIQIAHLKNAAI